MADWVLEMESYRRDVEGVGSEVSMLPMDVGEVDASDDGEEAKGDECKNLVGFQWGVGFFWVGSIQQQNARIGFSRLFPSMMQEENLQSVR
jgi:hypothetical protein